MEYAQLAHRMREKGRRGGGKKERGEERGGGNFSQHSLFPPSFPLTLSLGPRARTHIQGSTYYLLIANYLGNVCCSLRCLTFLHVFK